MRRPTASDFPAPLYGCAFDVCATEVSYPAEMLSWTGGAASVPAGFYCEVCFAQHPDLHGMRRGESLAQAMNRVGSAMI